MAVKNHSVGPFKPTQEDRAFVYQKASELQSPVLVIMNQKKEKYSVTFIIDPNSSNFQVTAEGNSIIDACMKVKQEAQKQISLRSQILNNENDAERDFLVHLMKNPIKIH